MALIITGIGSRSTPQSICAVMFKIGTWCNLHDVTIRSGHAAGADWAFESGAQSKCIAYIPWKGFNANLISKATLVIPDFDDAVMALAVKYHPAFDRLSFGAKKLIARNSFQVLGADLQTPANAIVCWTKGAKIIGGTGQALRIAKDYDIPVLNMAAEEYDAADKVTYKLKEMIDETHAW